MSEDYRIVELSTQECWEILDRERFGRLAEAVVEFKREVYRSALSELERFLAVGAQHHRVCHPYLLASRAHGAGRS